MEYLDVEEARSRHEPMLVLTEGVAGPWGEAAKAILNWKGISWTAVRQMAAAPNEELAAWTGQSSAPVLILSGEAPHLTLRQILFAAERRVPDQPLLPDDLEQRALLLGLCGELHLEMGLGWCRRLMMLDAYLGGKLTGDPAMAGLERLALKYGYFPDCMPVARLRVLAILRDFSARMVRQETAGDAFLFGGSLTVLDLIWATFSNLVVPLEPEDCPMPDHQRMAYTHGDAEILAAIDPALLRHRDRILREVVGLPLDF
jgi:glutathione S-transferase